ncbi:MDR family MFS transporter [Salipiger sp. CCB-MM3]|uniref:MDR family MFS transporter n=1 Tax=Salipiger sp. CCB-MM3 TaxID=1792508 RepID=UPI001F3CB297|nr:MDR family MFS transporter [Salipiger sp. CCB-MM3]
MTHRADPLDSPEPMAPARSDTDPAVIRLALIAVASTLLFASLGQTIVSTAMPTMVADLGGMEHITWVITAYLMASTIGAPIAGKLSDLFGRKAVLQTGIGVFLVGAVLCGFATNMGMVIAGRLVQGAGAGTLIVTSMAVVGDLVPARQRGQAQGLMGAAFGISTVVGPLLGGFIVQHWSWHWIFFVNFPVGALAFVVLGIALPSRTDHSHKPIDYLGALLLTTLLASAVLISNMGGSVLAWSHPGVLALAALCLGALVGFIAVERRAPEPILPLSLFRNNAFLVVNSMGFLVGMAMFGTITFLPLFLQVAKGISPTQSGLFLVPMMGGLLAASIGAGRVMSKTGRYKALPVAATALLALAMLTMTQVSGETPLWRIALSMVGVGLGLGPVFSVGVAAIQNSIPRSMIGIGTASANMFRLIGGSIGTAAFGAIFGLGLARNLDGALPEGASGGIRSMSAEMIAGLPPEQQAQIIEGFSAALHPVFWIASCGGLLACAIGLMLRERPLED